MKKLTLLVPNDQQGITVTPVPASMSPGYLRVEEDARTVFYSPQYAPGWIKVIKVGKPRKDGMRMITLAYEGKIIPRMKTQIVCESSE